MIEKNDNSKSDHQNTQPTTNTENSQSLITNSTLVVNEAHSTNLIIQSDQYQSSDLGPLNWLQNCDILNISPLDKEEEIGRHENRQAYLVHDQNMALSGAFTHAFSVSVTTTAVNPSYVAPTYVNTFADSNAKPSYSYTHLICMAIESSPNKCMTVNQIYTWCENHFGFFRNNTTGWKNSLRHNLSINKSFKRLPRDGRGPGRGAYWTIDPQERINLLEAVRRAPTANLTHVRPITFNAFQPLTTINSDMSCVNLTGYPVENGIRSTSGSSLIISTGASENRTSFNLISEVPTAGGGGGLLTTATTLTGSTPPEGPVSNLANQLIHSYLPLGISAFSGPVSQESLPLGTSAFESWPREEEEKYKEMMRLLVESSTLNGTHESNTVTPEKPKKETKHRRKSSLNPTVENMCDQCKENVASTCQSCSMRLWHKRQLGSLLGSSQDVARVLASVNSQNTLECNPELDRLLNTLEEDQDAPPLNWKKQPASAGEVFITPAPHLDHEYCHCQQHLRSQEDRLIVNSANWRLREEKILLLKEIAQIDDGFSNIDGPLFEESEHIKPQHHVRSTKRPPLKQPRGGVKRRLKAGAEDFVSISKVIRRTPASNRTARPLQAEEEDLSTYMENDEVSLADSDYYDSLSFTGHYRRIHRDSNDSQETDIGEEPETTETRLRTSSFSTTRKRRVAASPTSPRKRLKTKLKASSPTSLKSRVRRAAPHIRFGVDADAGRERFSSTKGKTVKKMNEYSDKEAARILIGIGRSSRDAVQSTPDLGGLQSNRSSEASLVASLSS